MKNRNQEHSDHWATPKYFYDRLNAFFDFTFDPCPLKHDVTKWNGLTVDWGERNFINPPYSRNLKDGFVKKALEESKKGKLCVILIPSSTSTELFHEVIKPNGIYAFVYGRIAFEGINTKGVFVTDKAPMHDSMVVVFDGRSVFSGTPEQLDKVINPITILPSLKQSLKTR